MLWWTTALWKYYKIPSFILLLGFTILLLSYLIKNCLILLFDFAPLESQTILFWLFRFTRIMDQVFPYSKPFRSTVKHSISQTVDLKVWSHELQNWIKKKKKIELDEFSSITSFNTVNWVIWQIWNFSSFLSLVLKLKVLYS